MWHIYLIVEGAGLLIALIVALVVSLRIGAWVEGDVSPFEARS